MNEIITTYGMEIIKYIILAICGIAAVLRREAV